MIFQRICIIGLGLIGGSLAKAIKRNNPDCFIVALDSDREQLKSAMSDGTIDKISENLPEGVKNVDLVFLCTPIHTIAPILEEIMPCLDENTVIMDVGSIKQSIMDAAAKACDPNRHGVYFVGGHPMAGTQHSGYQASLPHLFENAYFILTPSDSTPEHVLESLKEFLVSIGALPITLNAQDHDKIIGAVSHLPHVVAAALVNTIGDMDDPSHVFTRLAAGGFKDITRVASSDPIMWKNISLGNKEELISLINHITEHLTAFSSMLAHNKVKDVRSFFTSAKTFRDNLPLKQTLDILSYFDLYVDVEDKPGIIGDVATILGKHLINIKNLRIINSREGEPGSLVITFAHATALHNAQKVLYENGYSTYTK